MRRSRPCGPIGEMVEDREIGCWGTGRSLTSNVAFAENSSLQLVKRNRSVTALGFKSRHRSRSRSALRFRQPHSDLDRHQKEVPFGYVFHVGELWMFMSALTDFRWRLPRPFSELGAQGMTTTSCACSGGTPRPAARTDIFRAGTSRTCELGPGHDGRRRDLPQSVLRLPAWTGRASTDCFRRSPVHLWQGPTIRAPSSGSSSGEPAAWRPRRSPRPRACRPTAGN